MIKTVDIYTDGACSGNPGVGGYCAILIYGKAEKVVSGAENETTNNRMELLAVIMGLRNLKEKCNVNLWKTNGWKTSGKKEVKNVDLWNQLLELTNYHNVTFIKVKGHSDNEYNNRCDKIAVSEYKKLFNEENI